MIAAGAAILAAVVTAYATAYAARRKVAELRLANSFELAKQYLESARNYSETVYLPLAISVYRLHNSFLTFKAADDPRESKEATFADECKAFIDTVDGLFIRGATAVLTIRLDEAITRLISFLRESLSSKHAVKGTSPLDYIIGVGLGTLSITMPLAGASIGPLLELGTKKTSRPTYIAAPTGSKEFEEQFLIHVNTIKSGIKEVTLGGYKE